MDAHRTPARGVITRTLPPEASQSTKALFTVLVDVDQKLDKVLRRLEALDVIELSIKDQAAATGDIGTELDRIGALYEDLKMAVAEL